MESGPILPCAQSQKCQNVAWSRLRESLQATMGLANGVSPFSETIFTLLACLDELEVAIQNHQDCESFATEFTVLVQSLNQYMSVPPPKQPSNCIMRINMVVKRQVTELKEKLNQTSEGTREDHEDLVKQCQQIKCYFRKLEINESTNTWNTTKEHLANTKLKGLNPSKQAAYDSSLSTEINRRNCTEGTRIKVLDALDNWLYDPTSSPIYWLNGMAGTGKTTIASTFCERVDQRKLLVASFFCTRTSAECRNATRIVPTIAYQVSRYSNPFQTVLCEELEQNPDIGSKNMLKQFVQLLRQPLQRVKDSMPDNLVIVIDALDECDDRNAVDFVLDMLLHHAIHVPLKFLVTSRPEPEIHEKMALYAKSREVLYLHDIEKSLVQADIELYLERELELVSPSRAQIEQLAQRSGTLFIYAATLVKYICGKRSTDPQKRLRAVVDISPESTKKYAQIDTLYTTVLKSALSKGGLGTYKTQLIREVLWTVLLAQEPITIGTIEKLANIDDSQLILNALEPLRSVLHQSETGLVSTFHASFPDFLFDKARSGPYYCDAARHSQPLAWRCFLVMKAELRFNICNLNSSFLPDERVESLQTRLDDSVSPSLAYACRYWASHLELACNSDSLIKVLDEFLSHQLLFWMEVLSLRRELLLGIEGLLKAQRWLVASGNSSSSLMLFVDDARSFMTGVTVNPVSQSTPHIYLSALAFCPQISLVYKHYHKRTRGLLELRGSLMECREAVPLATWNTVSVIQCLALSSDGTRVAIGCLDTTISILSTYDGTVHAGPLQGHTSGVDSVAFSPDGGRVVSSSLGGIRVWDAYSGTQIAGPFKGHMRYINSVSFSPDGTRVVSCGHDYTIRVWNAWNGVPLLGPLTDHADLVLRVAFSPDGALIASASADQTIRLWDSDCGIPIVPPFRGHSSRVNSLAFTPNGSLIVSGSGDSIRVWKVPSGLLVISSFEGYSGGVNALTVSPDSTRIAAGCYDYAVRVWRIDNGKLVAGPFFGHNDSIKSVAYFPDGTRVISGSSNRTIHVWNVRDGMHPPPPLPPQSAVVAIKTIAFCPDNIHFMSSDGFGNIRIWDTSNASFITAPDKGVFFPTPLSILSPDGSCIVSTSEGDTLQLISTIDGSRVAGPFDIERTSLSTLSFSNNNKAIIMGCHDGTIKICNIQAENVTTGSFKGHHKGVRSLTESPNCSLLVSYSDHDKVLRVWNILTPMLDLKLVGGHAASSALGYDCAAVYDGWYIAEDGWVLNNSQHLLFWLPPDIASAWCSPYASLVVTEFGTLQIPRQKPSIGDRWIDCYISE